MPSGLCGWRALAALGRMLQTQAPRVLMAGAVLLALTGPTAAQTDPDDLARRHFESGAAYFEQAEYEEALREFNKAYELSQRPQILRNVSIVQERLGNLAGAVEALDAYLASAPNDPDVETVRIRRDNLKKRLEEEKAEAAAPVVKSDEKTEKKPESKQEKQEEPPDDSEPASFSFDDDEFADDGSDDEPSLVPAYIFLTAGGLSAIGAAVTGYMAADEHSRLESDCGARGCTDDEVAKGETLSLTSTVLTGVAVVGVSVGIIWLASSGSSDSAAGPSVTRSAEANPWPKLHVEVGREGGYGEAVWSF